MTTPQSETQVIVEVEKLLREGKADQALGKLDESLRYHPESFVLVRKKYDVLWSLKRFKECLYLLDDVYPNVPVDVQKMILNGKRFVLFELIKEAVKNGDDETALKRLEELADAGYRGFHDLNRDKLFRPLWDVPQYKEIQKKIAENAGIGRPPMDFSAPLISGEDFGLSAQMGKVVLVDFWSTSCVPCVNELPNLRSLYHALSKQGFEIVSISLDTDGAVLADFLAENPMPWKLIFSGEGFNDEIARLYDVSWIPSYWLVDGKGVLRYHDVRGEDLKSAVNLLLDEEERGRPR
ncbi:MAG: TlpA family protein disulfide reductase [Candidatus Krumholzibacteriota bacterium]|nr:TlpA family protein disulfide reductase [Candidatus Krumholzibacteriota bacterium]